MKKHDRLFLRLLLGMGTIILLIAAVPSASIAQDNGTPRETEMPVDRPVKSIDLAIALDTSSSMEHLIEAARLSLWEVVHELRLSQPQARIKVALLTFGNANNSPATGWVRIETDFTEDLDMVAERLFELSTAGGNEYVGRLMQMAVHDLTWATGEDAAKLLFVVGNEPADQDPQVDLVEISDMAQEQDISVHLVFCGATSEEWSRSWVRLAELAQGRFAVMDHRMAPVAIATPFDRKLAGLNTEVSETYLPLGVEGQERLENLAAWEERLDDISASAAASRAEVVSNPMYTAEWDLVDAFAAGTVDLYDLDEGSLPENMQAMSLREREIFLEDLQIRRDQLRRQIAELGAQRRQFVDQELKRRKIDTSQSFDTVIKAALRDELAKSGR